MDHSGIIKLKSTNRKYVLAFSAYKGNCIAAVFEGKEIIDRFSIPPYMRYLFKKNLYKLSIAKEDTKFHMIKTKFNSTNKTFNKDIEITFIKDSKYKYKPMYLSYFNPEIQIRIDFPFIVSASLSDNPDKIIPMSPAFHISYILDVFKNELPFALLLSKS